MEQVLLTLIATLIGTQTLVMRWLLKRSDSVLRSRDQTVEHLLQQLTRAVGAFEVFEKAEDEIHSRIIQAVDKMVTQLNRVADRLDNIDNKMKK